MGPKPLHGPTRYVARVRPKQAFPVGAMPTLAGSASILGSDSHSPSQWVGKPTLMGPISLSCFILYNSPVFDGTAKFSYYLSL